MPRPSYLSEIVVVTIWFRTLNWFLPVPGKFLGIVGQDPSDSKSNRLHIDIFHFALFIGSVFIDSSKMIGNSPIVSNFNRFICYKPLVLPKQWCVPKYEHGSTKNSLTLAYPSYIKL